MREVGKALKTGRALSVILAADIDHEDLKGGINEQVDAIINSCKDSGVPVVFALR
jgi:ribosomal protein L7Ae-like RNA K-turn-binding protein